MRLPLLIFLLAVLALATSAPAVAQSLKPWPPPTLYVKAECTYSSLNRKEHLVADAASAHKYVKAVALATADADKSDECFKVYSQPMYLLGRAWFENFIGTEYVPLHRIYDSEKAFEAAKTDLARVKHYALPASSMRLYSGLEAAANSMLRIEKSLKQTQIAINNCKNLVNQHGHFAGTNTAANNLDKQSRIAACVGGMGFPHQAVLYLKHAMHVIGDVTTDDVGIHDLGEDSDVTETADARLAILEFRAGKVAEARALVHGYYGNTPEMKAAWNMIDPAGHRKMMAKSDAEDRAFNAQFSADELRVLKLNGSPCNTSRSEDAYTGTIEIWYYDCIGDGSDDGDPGIGKESFTFVNGVLTDHTSI